MTTLLDRDIAPAGKDLDLAAASSDSLQTPASRRSSRPSPLSSQVMPLR
jgi:hypothetical protein